MPWPKGVPTWNKGLGDYEETCQCCGEVFAAKRSDQKEPRKYCSRECASANLWNGARQRKRTERECPNCGVFFMPQSGVNQQSCSPACGFVAMASKTRGKRKTPEQLEALREVWRRPGYRENQAEKMARWVAENGASKGRFVGSLPEVVMAALLMHAGIEFETQKQFGRYVVDFYLPDSDSVVEVDGVHWHQDTDKEMTRDEYLMERVSGVTHVTDKQLTRAGWLVY